MVCCKRLVSACLLALASSLFAGETLYNGIELPEAWPPREPGNPREGAFETPYLEHPPAVIPIDVGRQLFVDDFLVASTSNVVRRFFKPVKYEGNPVMSPETDLERQVDELKKRGYRQAPYAATAGGGVWWDPRRKAFRMWYESGWMNALSYAESKDGLVWTRPELDVVKGTNKLFKHDSLDSWSVFPDYAADNPYANWRLLISPPGSPRANRLYQSTDGVHWTQLGVSGESDDRTTMFYNPFRGKWVYSLRGGGPGGFGRNRAYWESTEFGKDCFWSWGRQHDRPEDASLPRAYAWLSTDRRDVPDPVTGQKVPQLYNVDAVAYESLMLGLFEIHLGPENDMCLKRGLPKITDIQFGYSRDGYHFSRPDRTAAIASSRWGSGAWDTGYIQPVSSGCVIRDERLWFYYSGIRGDETAAGPLVKDNWRRNGMHFHGSMGVATLRRDGFAGFVSDGCGEVTTRPVRFTGRRLFVNADCRAGELAVDVLDREGAVLASLPAVTGDRTKVEVGDVSAFTGRNVRLRFRLSCGTLYSFWVSPSGFGESRGWLAGGGPDYPGLRDVRPVAAKVTVDFTAAKGPVRPLNGICNATPLKSMGNPAKFGRVQGWMKELKLPYTRFHDAALENAGVDIVDVSRIFPIFAADPKDPKNYNFGPTDEYLANARATGTELDFRFGESIEHAATIYRAKVPDDIEKWAEICLEIARHYRPMVKSWSIWEEPNNKHLLAGKNAYPEAFCKMYVTLAKKLKAEFPDMPVGGPALMGDGENEIRAFLTACREAGAPLDFFSYTSYQRDIKVLVDSVRRVRRLLDDCGFAKTALHIAEWHIAPVSWDTSNEKALGAYMSSLTGGASSAYAAGVLSALQDAPVDRLYYYSAFLTSWGLYGNLVRRPTWYVFRTFADLVAAGTRVETVVDGPNGWQALAAKASNGEGLLMLSALCGRSGDVTLDMKGGLRPTEVLEISETRKLESVSNWRLDGDRLTIARPTAEGVVWVVRFRP